MNLVELVKLILFFFSLFLRKDMYKKYCLKYRSVDRIFVLKFFLNIGENIWLFVVYGFFMRF